MDMEEKLKKRGRFEDSDDDGDDGRYFDDTMREVELERSCVLFGYDRIEKDDEGEMNSGRCPHESRWLGQPLSKNIKGGSYLWQSVQLSHME